MKTLNPRMKYSILVLFAVEAFTFGPIAPRHRRDYSLEARKKKVIANPDGTIPAVQDPIVIKDLHLDQELLVADKTETQDEEEAALREKQEEEEKASKKQEEEAALQKQKEEAEALKKQEEEAALQKQKEEAEALKKQEEEAALQKQKEEEEARKRKEEEEAALQKQKEEAEARKRKEEEEAALQKQKEEEEARKRKEEEEAALQKQKEEEEARKRKEEEEAALQKQKEEEEARKRKEEEEAALQKQKEEEAKRKILVMVGEATAGNEIDTIESALDEANEAGLGEAAEVKAAQAKLSVIRAATKVDGVFPPAKSDIDALRDALSLAAEMGLPENQADVAFRALNAAERFARLKAQGEATISAREEAMAQLEKYQIKQKIDHLTTLGKATIQQREERAAKLDAYLKNQRLLALCSRSWYTEKGKPLFRLNPDNSVDVHPSAGVGPGSWSLDSQTDLSSSISVQVKLREGTSPFAKPKTFSFSGTVAGDAFDASVSTEFLGTSVASSITFFSSS